MTTMMATMQTGLASVKVMALCVYVYLSVYLSVAMFDEYDEKISFASLPLFFSLPQSSSVF